MPLFIKKNVKKVSLRKEKFLAKKLKGKAQINSGSLWFCKGDINLEDFLVEHKFTNKKSLILKKIWLDKIEHEAVKIGKTPLLILEIQGEKYVVGKLNDFLVDK